MGKSIVKVTLLVFLVVLCFWQIITLWLGDMSSHNFLVKKNVKEHITLVQPKAMWVNTGMSVFKIDENKNEYKMLIDELGSFIVSDVKSTAIEEEDSVTYEELLSMPGIIYEFNLPMGLTELIGDVSDKSKDKVMADQIFVDLSDYNDYKTNFYLTFGDKQSIYKITAFGRIKGHKKMLERFNNIEVTDNLMRYQPSITYNKQRIKGNSFMPFCSKNAPLEYDVLKVSNTIENQSEEEKRNTLEEYVNSFFSNPLLKEIDQKEDGSIIFSENMRAIVKYEPAGTLEFKVASASKETKLTNVERLAKVMKFIDECTGIPHFLKEGIYLSKITSKGGEYTYLFDYKYKGFSVQLSDPVKKTLGLEYIVQITVKNDEVASGKWSVLEISPFSEREIVKDEVRRDFDEVVNEMYERYIAPNESNEQLDKVQCQYIMNVTSGQINLAWTVLYHNKWYCP